MSAEELNAPAIEECDSLKMNINTPGDGMDRIGPSNDCMYEEFEDLEYENRDTGSNEALLPNESFKPHEPFNEDALKREIDKVENLQVEEVRWFYQSGKKKRYKPFLGSDSIAIETEYRSVSQSDKEIHRVCVRGGMYEVDVLEKKCFPIYWSALNVKGVEENVNILRGTWFYESNFTPLDEETADKIEAEHIERWKDCSLDEVKLMINNVVMHSVKLNQSHVDWYSVNDVYIHSDAVSYRALRNIVQKFGASKTSTSGHKLHRGYRENAMSEDCMPPVDHLVFVVHGIGSKPDRQKIVRNTNEFRLTCERATAKHFAHYTGRVEFLPVEWRSKLVLDDGIVETIMPKRGMGVRQFLNNSAMDIMFYTSPLYKQEIVDGLHNQISLLHRMFMERNPSFQGKISIFAHSLGCVIMHDIMTGWSPQVLFNDYAQKVTESSRDEIVSDASACQTMSQSKTEMTASLAKEMAIFSNFNKPYGLNFEVENFFCVGSPLGIFMALRGHRPRDGHGVQEDIIPRNVCKRIFNVYHPADPVAYRLEPLLLSDYSTISPLQVHSNGSLQLSPYEEMSAKTYSSMEVQQELTNISSVDFDQDTAVDGELEQGEGQSVMEGDDSLEKSDIYDTDSFDKKKDNPDDIAGASPTLGRRSSYLKALSGGAARMGKALWVRARGASSPPPVKYDDALVASQLSLNADESIQDVPLESNHSDKEDKSTIKRKNSGGTPQLTRKVQSCILPIDATELEHRLDYELQEGFTESKLGYASLTSHTSYWGNQDVALFVLMQIHPSSTMTQNLRSKI